MDFNTDIPRHLYTIHKFQADDLFVVRKSDERLEPIMTERGTVAKGHLFSDMEFFGMTYERAKEVQATLEAMREG